MRLCSLVNQHFILNIFYLMRDVFTPKRIPPYCPFQNNQEQVKILVLTAWWDAHRGDWLHRAMHTMQGDWLGGVMHTVEIDLSVWCIPQRLKLFLSDFWGFFRIVLTLWCPWHWVVVWNFGVSAILAISWHLTAFKGIIRYKSLRKSWLRKLVIKR